MLVFGKSFLAVSAATSVVLVCKSRTISAASPAPKYELRQVQVIFRHGARTPMNVPSYLPAVSYDKSLLEHASKTLANYEVVPLSAGIISSPINPVEDSYIRKKTLEGGCPPGQLTKIGAEQAYDLGAFLRKKYIKDTQFLNPRKLSEQIYIRSTNMERTIASARCALAGLLDGQFSEQPHKIFVASLEDEILCANYYACAQLKNLVMWTWNDQERLTGISDMKDTLRKSLNIPTDADLDLITLWDNFAVEAAHKLPSMKQVLSEEVLKRFEENVIRLQKIGLCGTGEDREITLKLAIGPFVDVLLKSMEHECSGSFMSNAKIRLYSGHDTTLIPLLGALGVEITSPPPCVGNIILELYRKSDVHDRDGDEGEYFVKVYYNGEQQSIGKYGNDEPCPLQEFQKVLGRVRTSFKEYRKLCRVRE